jgi:hypothetical protein
LKAITIDGRKLYIYPTVKGLVKEGDEVAKAFEKIQPDVVCVSLSDRELAEVRMSLNAGNVDDDVDYIPESRRVQPVSEEETDDKDDDLEDDDELDDYAEVEAPAGIVPAKVVREALDEPFHADLVAADSAARSDQVFVSDTDMTYSRKLAAFGDVELPPPSFMEAVRLADRRKVSVEPIDLDDNEYTIVFCDHVSYWMLVRHSRKVRGMRRRLRAQGPQELATEWDRRLRTIKGFDVLERERERKMAAGLVGQLERHKKVLAVIDLPRVDGVLEELTARTRG